MNGLSPSLLTVSCSLGEEKRNLAVDVGRPVKLSLSRGLIERSIDFLLELEELVMPYLSNESADVSIDSHPPPPTQDNNSSDNKVASSSFVSKLLNSEVSISTSQILFELKLSTFLSAPPISRDLSVSSEDYRQDEVVSNSYLNTPPSLKESLLGGWDGLVVTVPWNEQKGYLSITGVQLLSVYEGAPYFIVPPAQFHCTLSQHLYMHNLYVLYAHTYNNLFFSFSGLSSCLK